MRPGRSKYSAIKTDCAHGHLHDSKMEARRCDELHVLEAQGLIQRLEQQPVFPVIVGDKVICKYIADFAWFTKDCRVIEDCKGVTTPVFNLKKKLVEACHPGTVITLYPPRKRKTRKKKAA